MLAVKNCFNQTFLMFPLVINYPLETLVFLLYRTILLRYRTNFDASVKYVSLYYTT